jgi:hypothetical protein
MQTTSLVLGLVANLLLLCNVVAQCTSPCSYQALRDGLSSKPFNVAERDQTILALKVPHFSAPTSVHQSSHLCLCY